MMNTPIFSIILPIYNANLYVKETILSILGQNFSDYELLLIDDGSTDGSGRIAEEISSDHANVFYYKTDNGGVCSARNYGLKLAKGKYILFCDHDDLFLDGLLQRLFLELENKEVDILKFSYETSVLVNGKITKSYMVKSENKQMKTIDLKANYSLFNGFVNVVWNGAYRREFLLDHGLLFDEKIKYGQEDVIFNLNILSYDFNLMMIENLGYKHFIRHGQSNSRNFNITKLDAINKSLQLESSFLGYSNDDTNMKIMAKYIRSFFVSLGMTNKPFENDDIKKSLDDFNRLLPQDCSYRLLVKTFIKYPKDVIKIILYKMHAFGLLIIMLGNQ